MRNKLKNADRLMVWQTTRTRGWSFLGLAIGVAVAWLLPHGAHAQNVINPGAALAQEFENCVADYMKLHKSAEDSLPPLRKPTDSPERLRNINAHFGRQSSPGGRRPSRGTFSLPESLLNFAA